MKNKQQNKSLFQKKPLLRPNKKIYRVGIDEVGRGPVAGPVSVCAFGFLMPNYTTKIRTTEKKLGINLRDSKKLTHKSREIWFAEIKKWQRDGLCDFYVSSVSASMIDKIGISKSIKRALATSLSKISAPHNTLILLDGGLRASSDYGNQKTIIKGDEKEMIIACASIMAKVTRDRYMTRMSTKYPEYGFDRHVGYGTRAHSEAIKNHGLTPLHRKTFLSSFFK